MQKPGNFLIFFVLGLLWSSFAVFTKISAANLSPFFVAFARLFIGGTLIYAVCLAQRKNIFIAKNFKRYAIVGFFNSALPFTLFASASQNVDSAIAAILDGTVPMFEVLISALILKRLIDRNSLIGVISGALGVLVTYSNNLFHAEFTWLYSLSIVVILLATASYAAASLYLNEKCRDIEPMTMACGSVFAAILMLSPSLFVTEFSSIDFKTFSSLLGLGLLCTGFAYILFFRLLQEEGPRIAVSVVLLIPVFGTIFGALFLGETITINKILGSVMILVSMKFILNLPTPKFLNYFTKKDL